MSSNDLPFSVLRPSVWLPVKKRLDAAVEADPSLAPLRERLLRPLLLLDALAADAPGALGDDVLAAERVRTMLYAVRPWMAVAVEVSLVETLESASVEGEALLVKRFEALLAKEPFTPAVLDQGALLIVGLAALRVAPSPLLATLFISAVAGLSFAAAPIEALGRLEPEGYDAAPLELFLETLRPIEPPAEDSRAAGLLGGAEDKRALDLGSENALEEILLSPYFTFDPVERGRRACLLRFFGPQGILQNEVPSQSKLNAADADGIARVDPRRAAIGATLTLRGSFPTGGGEDGEGGGQPPGVDVIFAAPRQPPHVATVTSWSQEQIEVTVPDGAALGWIGFSNSTLLDVSNTYRDDLRARWSKLGSDDACLLDTPIPVDRIPKLGLADPAAEGLFAVPPRSATNRYDGGQVAAVTATLSPSTIVPQGALQLSWSSAAELVLLDPDTPAAVELAPSGTLVLHGQAKEGPISFTLVPAVRRDGEVLRGAPVVVSATVRVDAHLSAVVVSQNGRTAPIVAGQPIEVRVAWFPPTNTAVGGLIVNERHLEPTDTVPGKALFTVDGDQVANGVAITATLSLPGAQAPFERQSVSLTVNAPTTYRVMVVRPVRPGPPRLQVSLEGDVLPAFRGFESANAAAIEVHELPWIDDALAVVLSLINSADDARVPALLEQLSRAAARTPGFEDALWVAVVPDAEPVLSDGEEFTPQMAGYQRNVPAETALAVAVCNSAGLGDLLNAVFLPAPAAVMVDTDAAPTALATAAPVDPRSRVKLATPRLRLVGRLYPGGRMEIDPTRVETRRAGPGATVSTLEVAVALDTQGRELYRTPLKLIKDVAPAQFALLMPVSPEVATVEIRRDNQTIRKIIAIALPTDDTGAPKLPTLTNLALSDGERNLKWTYRHPGGSRATLMVEVGKDNVWTQTPIVADSCGSSMPLEPQRFGQIDSVRLVASDGWNAVSADVPFSGSETPVVIRRLADGRFWADTTSNQPLSWMLGKATVPSSGAFLRLDGARSGRLLLLPPGSPATAFPLDSRVLGAPE